MAAYRRPRITPSAAARGAALALAIHCAGSLAADPTVVASGLANPRGIDFAPDGSLYVAEAGSGGNGACTVLGNGLSSCYGETGALTWVDPEGARPPERVIDRLPSLAAPGGVGATGPHDVSFLGNGTARILMGLGTVASAREGLGPRARLFGRVLRVNPAGRISAGGDLAAFEEVENPVPPGDDSNPYGVAALPGRAVVADAGGNTLLEAGANGGIDVLAQFPARDVLAPPFLGLPAGATIPMQAVPTSVALGPDGWLYVGQLTGFPFPVGGANVYRVPRRGGEPEVAYTGFTNIIDLAFDAAGNLYVLEIGSGLGAPPLPLAPPGRLWRIAGDGTRTEVLGGLFFPGGVAVGEDALFVTNASISPTAGEVLRVELE